MRARFALGSMGLVFVLGACTSLLGEFTVGDGGGTEGGGGDAPSDGPTLQTVHCNTGPTRTPITSGGALHANQLRMAALPDGRVRMVVPDTVQADGGGTDTVLHAFTVAKNDASAPMDLNVPLPGGRVLSVVRYNGTPSGFAALYEANDPNDKLALFVAKLPDDGAGWTPALLTESPAAGVSGASTNATFVVTDPANDQYFVTYSVTAATMQTLYAGMLSPGSGNTLNAPVTSFPANGGGDAYGFNNPATAIQPGQLAYVMMSPNGSAGPPPQGAPVQVIVPGPGNKSFALTPPGALNYFPAAFASSTAPDKANVAMLVANLFTYTGGYYVGQVPYASLSSSFDPTTLTPTLLAASDGGPVSLKQLFVGGSTQHWEIPPLGSAEQLLMIGPTVDPVGPVQYPGVNFAWWDGPSGINRTFQTGDDNLLGDVSNIAVADITFVGLSGSVGTFILSYIADLASPAGSTTPGDLVITTLGCQP